MYLVTRNNQVVGEYQRLQDFLIEHFDISIDQKEKGGWLVSIRSVSPFYRPNAWSGTWSDEYTHDELITDIARDTRVRNFVGSYGFVIYKVELV